MTHINYFFCKYGAQAMVYISTMFLCLLCSAVSGTVGLGQKKCSEIGLLQSQLWPNLVNLLNVNKKCVVPSGTSDILWNHNAHLPHCSCIRNTLLESGTGTVSNTETSQSSSTPGSNTIFLPPLKVHRALAINT
jgi:hypothetical protein